MSKTLFLVLISLSFTSYAEITIDGKLDEPQWQDAQKFNQLLIVEPYTLSIPEYTTEILVTTDSKGIYFGIKNYQPVNTRNTDISARDAGISSDRNKIIIDFDNNGITAYSFEIGSGGSIRDGIWSNENNFSNEWDGTWSAKTFSTNKYWITETLIPWDVVSMNKSKDQQRDIKWYVSRRVANQNLTFANAPTNDDRQRFISDFPVITIQDFSKSSLQLFGYISGRQDFHLDEHTADAGLDIFWKSGNGKQLTATINPDFGQIESDGLVVNFSATETFFNERRPFFTENQSLFNVSGANNLRLIHTRRIGASPDASDALVSDINAAVKFTDNKEAYTYGLFAATEDSGDGFKGRDFFVSRFAQRSGKQSLGFTGTYVNRIDIDRKANVYAINHEYRISESLKFVSQLINTNINQTDNNSNDWGNWVQVQHQINENRSQTIQFSHYGDQFEINDFGYLPRNNLNTAYYEQDIKKTNYAENSIIQQREFNIDFTFRSNDSGDRLDSTVNFNNDWNFKDSSSFDYNINLQSAGINDLISRGNGNLNTKSGYEAQVSYSSSNTGKLRYHGNLRYINRFDDGKGFGMHIHPSYYFQDNYNISWGSFYTDTRQWLNWLEDDLFGKYDRKIFNSTLDFNANISPKQELRLRFQWIAIDAKARDQYQLDNSGDLINTNQNIDDFTISTTALQIRYRYEIAPLSNIFVVYSRGASAFSDETTGLTNLFDSGFSNVNSNNFLVKIRYRFM